MADLKRRGLLDSTRVDWVRVRPEAGVRGAAVATAIPTASAVDPGTLHDVRATILHLPGADSTRLSDTHNGRPHRPTDVPKAVIAPILAWWLVDRNSPLDSRDTSADILGA